VRYTGVTRDEQVRAHFDDCLRAMKVTEGPTKSAVTRAEMTGATQSVIDRLQALGFVPQPESERYRRAFPSLPERVTYGATDDGDIPDAVNTNRQGVYKLRKDDTGVRAERLHRTDDYRHEPLILHGNHSDLVEYMDADAEAAHEAQLDAAGERAKKMARRAQRSAQALQAVGQRPLTEDEIATKERARIEVEKAVARHRSVKQQVADLYQHGFFAEAGNCGGDWYDTLHEFFGLGKLRSHLGSPSLAHFARATPRQRELLVGDDKTAVGHCKSKALGLTARYVTIDRRRLMVLIVELDTCWRTADLLRRALLTKLEPEMMPNLVVGRTDPDGWIQRPHLIWCLKSAVWNDVHRTIMTADGAEITFGDTRCRQAPIDFYFGVQRGLVDALIDLGADPGQTNVFKTKNPLSPRWSTFLFNDDKFYALGDFLAIKGFDTHPSDESMRRRATAVRVALKHGVSQNLSSSVWNSVGAILEPIVRRELSLRSPEFIAAGVSESRLAAWFDEQIRDALVSELGASDALNDVLERRCEFAARYCRSDRWKTRSGRRGRDRDLRFTKPRATKDERQGDAGRRSGQQRSDVAFEKLKVAIQNFMRGTGVIRKAAFLKSIVEADKTDRPVGKTFAYDNFDHACKSLGIEFRDGVGSYIASTLPARPSRSFFLKMVVGVPFVADNVADLWPEPPDWPPPEQPAGRMRVEHCGSADTA
jgi:hypothetical protein